MIVISAGFSEIGNIKEEEELKNSKEANISLIGPNCLGIINTKVNLNASFAPLFLKGNIALCLNLALY